MIGDCAAMRPFGRDLLQQRVEIEITVGADDLVVAKPVDVAEAQLDRPAAGLQPTGRRIEDAAVRAPCDALCHHRVRHGITKAPLATIS